jgi:hypothetical protein
MEFWLAQVTEIPVVIDQFAAEARLALVPGAMQTLALARRPVAENQLAQAKRERLGPAVPAWQSDRPALVFAAPAGQLSIPWRA